MNRQWKLIFAQSFEEGSRCTVLMRLRSFLRLFEAATALRSGFVTARYSFVTRATVNQHRYHETINGRQYQIDVSHVGRNQWRAQIARTPGGSAALMPFYGTTPDEAAALLTRWLSIVAAPGRPAPERPKSDYS
jgi:hypothetical protein